jgi:Tfp pilus assembly protein PilX
MMKSARQSGQALLIILLVMAVGLTIALSIISRSVTDIRISQEEEESARAFSAAEAGIEESLKLGSAATTVSFEGIDVQVTGTDRGGGPNFVFDEPAVEGETQTLWLISHDADGGLIESPFYTQNTLEVCWQKTDPETALEVTIFYKDAADDNYKVARGAYDSEAVSRGNNFSSPDAGNCSGLAQFERRKSLNLGDFGITPATDTLIALRLRSLYNQTEIGVVGTGGDPGGLIPTQGKCYESTATTETGVSRKVRQCQSYPAPPAIFDYVLFSGGDIETTP